jgi:hypothetical protein
MSYPLQEIFSGRERATRHRKRSAVAAGAGRSTGNTCTPPPQQLLQVQVRVLWAVGALMSLAAAAVVPYYWY